MGSSASGKRKVVDEVEETVLSVIDLRGLTYVGALPEVLKFKDNSRRRFLMTCEVCGGEQEFSGRTLNRSRAHLDTSSIRCRSCVATANAAKRAARLAGELPALDAGGNKRTCVTCGCRLPKHYWFNCPQCLNNYARG